MKVLVVIDMQNDFITGALGSDAARAIVPAVARRVALARERDEAVFFTLDTHADNYLSTQEGHNLPVKHCVAGTQGHEIASEILSQAGECEKIIKRDSFGCYELVERLAALSPLPRGKGLEIEVCGLCAEICVSVCALMIKGVLPEAEICVNPELTAGLDSKGYEAALTVMSACQIRIIK
ncbi:MAG: isochorismatase family cysteine hydrolase [Clostridia bacterium]|nr:isochorismatase family cysteine hydrolase [Clostridia bacterium]